MCKNKYYFYNKKQFWSLNPVLAPRSWKSRAIPLPTLWATPGL